MNKEMITYSLILLVAYFISAVSQVLLKKAAEKKYAHHIQEYLNPLVIFAYILFFGTTFLAIYSYKVVPLSMGPILEAANYIWISIFGVVFFKEKIGKRKIGSLLIIICGILVFGFWG